MSFNISKNSNVQRKGGPNDETAEHVAAFTGRYEYDEDSCDEEVTYEELLTSYIELYAKDEEICKILEKQKKTINQLQTERSDHLATITELNDEVTRLNSQLENMKKQVRMMNTGTDLLEEILEGQNQGKPKAIGFDYRALNQQQQNKESKFVPTVEAYDPTTGKPMLQHPKEHPAPKSKGISRRMDMSPLW
jgi:chromosome segregation ATPase